MIDPTPAIDLLYSSVPLSTGQAVKHYKSNAMIRPACVSNGRENRIFECGVCFLDRTVTPRAGRAPDLMCALCAQAKPSFVGSFGIVDKQKSR